MFASPENDPVNLPSNILFYSMNHLFFIFRDNIINFKFTRKTKTKK